MPIMEQVIASDPTGEFLGLTEMLVRIEEFQQSIPPVSDCR